MPDDDRHYTTYVHGAAAPVWKVLTSEAEQGEWYLPAVGWDFGDGGVLAWGADGQTYVHGTVRAVRPKSFFLSHTFQFAFLDEPPGLVRWRVTQMGDVAQVWLRHELVERPATGGIVGGSWPVMLARLKTLVETGRAMPEPAWPTEKGWDVDPD